jgi:hypothetical protein
MSLSKPAAQAALAPSAQAILDQAQALLDFRNAQRHFDNLEGFLAEETQRRRERVLQARQRLVRLGGQHILDELDVARRDAALAGEVRS